jgi:uracil-DNA glycosylase
MQVKINESWKAALECEFDKTYFGALTNQIKLEYSTKSIFPEPSNIFRAFDLTPFESVKVVILGQDPYHTPGVADGLAFSTKPGNRVPPSLQNIYKEIQLEFPELRIDSQNPDLTSWALQGVLLLNNTLTVQSGIANSHSKLGWNQFTDRVIEILASKRNGIVFILWGGFARSKKTLINPYLESNKHLVLESAHPSPLSAHNGFFGNGHFKLCNEFLESSGKSQIEW